MTYTDISAEALVLRMAPPAARPYLLLARLDRPVGIWLLLLPGWWALALAGSFHIWLWIAFFLGAVIMRAAGCVINDLLDRDLDRQVARTAGRPLASGAVSPKQAMLFLAGLLGAGFCILVTFNAYACAVGALSLLLVASYPLMKRITFWPQAFLGLTFSWGALLGTAAALGALTSSALLLYAAAAQITIGYDTIYAHQDIEDDIKVGVKSTARLFGANGRIWVAGFMLAGWLLLAVIGFTAALSAWYFLFLAGAGVLMVNQVKSWRMFDPADSLKRFKQSVWIEVAILVAIFAGVVF